MQYEVTMRDGSSYQVEAAYIEVVNGATSSTYTLLGPVPGYPTAILAAFPVDLVVGITPSDTARAATQKSLQRVAELADQRRLAGPQLVTEDYY